jgi:hypothetical protein
VAETGEQLDRYDALGQTVAEAGTALMWVQAVRRLGPLAVKAALGHSVGGFLTAFLDVPAVYSAGVDATRSFRSGNNDRAVLSGWEFLAYGAGMALFAAAAFTPVGWLAMGGMLAAGVIATAGGAALTNLREHEDIEAQGIVSRLPPPGFDESLFRHAIDRDGTLKNVTNLVTLYSTSRAVNPAVLTAISKLTPEQRTFLGWDDARRDQLNSDVDKVIERAIFSRKRLAKIVELQQDPQLKGLFGQTDPARFGAALNKLAWKDLAALRAVLDKLPPVAAPNKRSEAPPPASDAAPHPTFAQLRVETGHIADTSAASRAPSAEVAPASTQASVTAPQNSLG